MLLLVLKVKTIGANITECANNVRLRGVILVDSCAEVSSSPSIVPLQWHNLKITPESEGKGQKVRLCVRVSAPQKYNYTK